jgi:hypothetical protein
MDADLEHGPILDFVPGMLLTHIKSAGAVD